MFSNLDAAFKAFFKTLFAKYFAKGQAAVKIAEHDTLIEFAKGRLAVVNESNRLKAVVVADLQKAADQAHQEADKITSSLKELTAKL